MTIENDLTEAKKLQQLAKKHKKSAAAAELSPTFFDEKIEELKTQHAIATKAVEQLGLASKYLHECPHPCLNGMVEDFVRKAQANLVEAKEQITKIKNAMQEAVNPSEPAPTKRIPHPKASHTAKPNHTKANRRISRT